jgi:predicted enzyme related to lactoylglutathione lyase
MHQSAPPRGSQNFSYIIACYDMKDGASKAKARGCKVAKASGKKKKA